MYAEQLDADSHAGIVHSQTDERPDKEESALARSAYFLAVFEHVAH